MVFERYRLHPEADESLDRSGGLARQQLTQWRAFRRLLRHTDVFHFYFGLTLVPKSLQFRLLRAKRKKSRPSLRKQQRRLLFSATIRLCTSHLLRLTWTT